MTFAIKTPLLKMNVDALMWVMEGIKGSTIPADDAKYLQQFCKAVVEKVAGRRGQEEVVRTKWQNLPVYMQHHLTGVAVECGCSQALVAMVGPLPEPDQPLIQRPPEPMF